MGETNWRKLWREKLATFNPPGSFAILLPRTLEVNRHVVLAGFDLLLSGHTR
jgi:hypothetical protein